MTAVARFSYRYGWEVYLANQTMRLIKDLTNRQLVAVGDVMDLFQDAKR